MWTDACQNGILVSMKKPKKPNLVPAAAMADPNPVEEVGYARVSTADQSVDMQVALLVKRGINPESIFTDVGSGAKMKRDGLAKALRLMTGREGWTLVVWKLDRLGRDVKGLVDLMARFTENNWNLVSLTEQIDTRTPFGKFYLHMLACLAQLERDMTVERTKAGMARLKERGFKLGRHTKVKRKTFEAVQKRLEETKEPIASIARRIGMSPPFVNHWFPGWRGKTQAERIAHRKRQPFPEA